MRWIALFVLVFCSTIFLNGWRIPEGRHGTDSAATTSAVTVASGDSLASDRVTVVSLVVSPTCAACNDPALASAFEEIRRSQSVTSNRSVRFVGVVLARSAAAGLQFLDRFGPFSDVLTGTEWDGVVGRMYLREVGGGVQAVPQIMVVEQTDEIDATIGRRRSTGRLVQRRVGLDAIVHLGRVCAAEGCLQP
jgi:hypothetical protein